MLRLRFLVPGLLALSISGGPLLAQEEAPGSGESAARPAPADASAGQGPDATGEPGSPSAREAARGSAGDRADPFDYEASEQISEDLSVAFPVDI